MKDNIDTQTPSFVTPKQLASRWQCTIQKLRRMRRAGVLPVYYIGRSARYSLGDVERIEREARA
jgi:hypothetical protein